MAYVPFHEGNFYPMEFVEENHFPHSVFMINFCMSPRSAINFALFGVNLILEEIEQGPKMPLPLQLQYPMILVAVRLTSQGLYDRIGAGTMHFWNRIFYDYFLNIKIRHDFSMEEQVSMRYTSCCSINIWEDFQWPNGVTSTSSIRKVKVHFIQ